MATLTSGLLTLEHGTTGWAAIVTTNFQLIDVKLLGPFVADNALGVLTVTDEATTQADPAALTIVALVDSTGGTPSQTLTAVDFGVTVTATDLTDSSGGSTDGTVSAVSGSGADATINDNFAECVKVINELAADVAAIKTVIEGQDDLLNDLIASMADEINAAGTDLGVLRTNNIGIIDYVDAVKSTLNTLQGKLRKTSGCGVFDDNP